MTAAETRRAARLELTRVGAGSGATLAAFTLIGILINVLLARLLAPEGLGIYASAFALGNVLAVLASAGLPTTLARMLPQGWLNAPQKESA